LLEDHGIKVALLDGPEDFDGACAATHDEHHVDRLEPDSPR
jgi:hypothetical protein